MKRVPVGKGPRAVVSTGVVVSTCMLGVVAGL